MIRSNIIFDEEKGVAALVDSDKPFGPLFYGSRECSLDAKENAELFLRACSVQNIRPERLEPRLLDTLVAQHEERLSAVFTLARQIGEAVDATFLEAAIRGKSDEYALTFAALKQTGNPDVGFLFKDALKDYDWDVRAAEREVWRSLESPLGAATSIDAVLSEIHASRRSLQVNPVVAVTGAQPVIGPLSAALGVTPTPSPERPASPLSSQTPLRREGEERGRIVLRR